MENDAKAERCMVVKTSIRVIYGDTDAMGQTYYGNYLKWFEIGRTEWFRALGSSYREVEAHGIFLPVVESHCFYRKPALYDDVVTIATTFSFAGPARLRFDCEILRDGEVLTTGYTVHVCMNGDRKVVKPPEFLRTMLEAGNSPTPS